MKRIMCMCAVLLYALGAISQAKAPKLPDAVVAKFWKASAQVQSAQTQLLSAQAQMQAVVKEMQEACGAEHQPSMSPTGDPECVAKPKAVTPNASK